MASLQLKKHLPELVILTLCFTLSGVIVALNLSADKTVATGLIATDREQEPEDVTKININTATAEELETLPSIGPAIAGRIVEYRSRNGSFESVEGLLEIKGIGEKTLEEIRPFITAGTAY